MDSESTSNEGLERISAVEAGSFDEEKIEQKLREVEREEGERLTEKQEAFCREYVIDRNGMQAAIRAGYAYVSAAEVASQLIRLSKVQQRIHRGRAFLEANANLKQETILNEMATLAQSSIDHYDYDEETGRVFLAPNAPPNAMHAIAAVKRRKTVTEDDNGNVTIRYDVEIKLWDKPTPLKLMGRHVGLFPDRVEVTGKGGAPIELGLLTNDQLKQKLATLNELATKIKE